MKKTLLQVVNNSKRTGMRQSQQLKSFAWMQTITAVLSEMDGIFTIKDNQKKILKAFLGGQHVFALLTTGFGKSSLQHKVAIHRALMGSNNWRPRAVAFWLN